MPASPSLWWFPAALSIHGCVDIPLQALFSPHMTFSSCVPRSSASSSSKDTWMEATVLQCDSS